MSNPPFDVLHAFDDTLLRYGFWPANKGRSCGTVLVLGGRSEFMEKYLVTIEELNIRGYDVYSFDWRGQGLSGRLLADSEKGHVQTYADYMSDLELLLKQVVLSACQRPLILLGHSMGAHIGLRHLSRAAGIVDMAVLIGPMIQINLNPLMEVAARQLSRLMCLASKGHVAMPSLFRKDSFSRSFKNNWLTSDEKRFYAIRRMLSDNPRLRVSGATFGWLSATFDSIDALRAEGVAEKITTPALMVIAGRDHVVCNTAACHFAAKVPGCRLENIDGAYHEILQEREDYRRQFWRAFDSFLAN